MWELNRSNEDVRISKHHGTIIPQEQRHATIFVAIYKYTHIKKPCHKHDFVMARHCLHNGFRPSPFLLSLFLTKGKQKCFHTPALKLATFHKLWFSFTTCSICHFALKQICMSEQNVKDDGHKTLQLPLPYILQFAWKTFVFVFISTSRHSCYGETDDTYLTTMN